MIPATLGKLLLDLKFLATTPLYLEQGSISPLSCSQFWGRKQ